MGVFGSIKDAIFGKDDKGGKPPVTSTAPAKPVAKEHEPTSVVDVEQRLDAIDKSAKYNWRTSIVDLLKLLNLDASYENRKELAVEMGRTDYEGSAEDNIWLHRRVMEEIAARGGRVPAEFRS